MGLTSQTLLVDFHNFIEVFPPICIDSLSHLKYTIMGEEIKQQQQKMYLLVSQEESSRCLVFHKSLTVHSTYNHWLPMLYFSGLEAEGCHVTLALEWAKISQRADIFAERQNGRCPHVSRSL